MVAGRSLVGLLMGCGVLSTVTIVAQSASSIPQVAQFYTLSRGARVSFDQQGEVLKATWMMPDGTPYGHGTYQWDPSAKSFKGRSTTIHVCLEGDGYVGTSVSVLIREELSVVTENEIRDLWTKPLAVDCGFGVVEKFKWNELRWFASDKDGKLLPAPPPPLTATTAH